MRKGVKIPTLKCLRCGHEWVPSVPRPRACPACKNYSWDELPKEKGSAATDAAAALDSAEAPAAAVVVAEHEAK